jgi:DNA-binding transcriptional regulator YiaG
MTPHQYAEAIARLGLSQRAAGKFLGVDERTSRKWIAGDARIPESAAVLLRLMIRLKIKPEDVCLHHQKSAHGAHHWRCIECGHVGIGL